MPKNDTHLIRFAAGTGRNFGKATNVTKSWITFKNDFRKPVVTAERVREYQRMSDEDQKNLKGVAGWIYRTQIDGPVRNRGSGLPSDLITFDFDYATPEYLEEVMSGKVASEYEYFIHSSRRHTEEKPRFRGMIPTKTPIPNDIYNAVSRIVATVFDPELRYIDKVSFRPAQMMFRPTISKDGEFVFYENHGELLDWEAIVDAYALVHGDWHDIGNLPTVAGEKLRETSERAEDPTEKAGPVGDFCRAYTVMDAIETFLPDTYVAVDAPSAKPRYTYAKGTTTNGAEVQDDGLFLYSHHGSDPCADMLVNAFDLVRIHKFGDLDTKLGSDVETMPMAKRPSFRAMVEFIKLDPEYRKAVIASRYDVSAMTADFTDDMISEEPSGPPARTQPGRGSGVASADISAEEAAEIADLIGDTIQRDGRGAPVSLITKVMRKRKGPPPANWLTDLETTMNGDLVSNSPNLAQIIVNDLRLRNAVEHNDFVGRMVCREPIKTRMPFIPTYPIADPINGEPIQDHHLHAIRMMLEAPNGPGKAGYGLRTVTDRDLMAAIETAARLNSFNPVLEYFEAGKWDGQKRMDTMFIRYMGCPDTPYHREIARLFLLGAVARAYEPGHKFDYVPILVGGQGKRKSTWISLLAKNWFGELSGDFGDVKEMVEQMMGRFILELPELSSLGRSQVEDAKQFVSATSSYIRLSYGRLPRHFPRQCVFIGSTNDDEYLIDKTGNRRWWPVNVEVDMIDTDAMAAEVDQLWAEAVVAYKMMRKVHPKSHGHLKLMLSKAAVKEAMSLQENARVQTESDSYAHMIKPWLDRKTTPPGTDDFDHAKGPVPMIRRKRTTIHEVWVEAMGMGAKINMTDSRAIGRALRELGWRPTVAKDETGRSFKAFIPSREVRVRWWREDVENRSEDDMI